MSEIYRTGSAGERLAMEWLVAQGRVVERSGNKTFDLVVDGKYAEVKTSQDPYAKLGFIGLTRAQYEALTEGIDFSVIVVCNARDPANVEVIEIPAANLRQEPPTVEPTYYWYRSQLERCRPRSAT